MQHHPLRRAAPLAALALLAACADVPTRSDRAAPPADGPAAPFYAGAFLGDAESTPERIAPAIRDFGARTGTRLTLVKTFHDLECDFAPSGWCGRVLREVHGAGAASYLAIDVRWRGAPDGGVLSAIAAGHADGRLASIARDLAAFGEPVLLEPAWEMNGDWAYAWQGVENGAGPGAPAAFRAAWRHIVEVFRREGATNVRWVFNPNVGNPVAMGAGPSHWNWYANYYPGDDYVDFVGAHGFNAPRLWGGAWRGFLDTFDGPLADRALSDMKARYPGKPLIVGEMASEEGAGDAKAEWIAEAYRALVADPRVAGAVWFDMDKEADWRLRSSPSAEAAYRRAVAGPRVAAAAAAGAAGLAASR
jgi:endoglucanase